MKKTVAVFLFTIFLMCAAIFAPRLFEKNLPKTSITKLSSITYIDSVSAAGEVTKKDAKSIKAEMPIIISKVLVKNGEQISVGQPILTVNQAETAKKMMEINQYAALAKMGAGSTATSYEDVLALIPKNVLADVAGTIDNVSVSDGDYVAKDDTIASLIGSDGLIINASISENSIAKVAVGQPVVITGSGFSSKKYSGVVEEISNTAKKEYVGTSADTVVNVRIRFTDADKAIRLGYSAKVKILTSEQKNINVIPYEAVMEDDKNKEYVYVFSNGAAVRKDIKTGIELGEGVEVVNGISPEDYILSSPQNIAEGEYVKIVKKD